MNIPSPRRSGRFKSFFKSSPASSTTSPRTATTTTEGSPDSAPSTGNTTFTEPSPIQQPHQSKQSAAERQNSSRTLDPARLFKSLKRARSPTPTPASTTSPYGPTTPTSTATTGIGAAKHVSKKRSIGDSRSAVAAGLEGDDGDVGGGGMVVVHSPMQEDEPEMNGTRHHNEEDKPIVPTLPNFLSLSNDDMQRRFFRVDELEQQRMHERSTSSDAPTRWQRVNESRAMLLDRYTNIWPFQGHRVKLQVPQGRLDYINASPIEVTHSKVRPPRLDGGADHKQSGAVHAPHHYIAMQGPKKNSVGRVWRMVTEQLSSEGVIVMLTEPTEGPMEKCYPYYPLQPGTAAVEVNTKDEWGDGYQAFVRCEAIEETELGDALALRKLVVRFRRARHDPKARSVAPTPKPSQDVNTAATNGNGNGNGLELDDSMSPRKEAAGILSSMTLSNGGSRGTHSDDGVEWEEQTIWHFLYKKWPDFGVVEDSHVHQLRILIRLAREKNVHAQSPLLVHCSAGVGRSGTYITLEQLLGELEAGTLERWDEHFAPPAVPQPGQAQTQACQVQRMTNGHEPGHDTFSSSPMDAQDNIVLSTTHVANHTAVTALPNDDLIFDIVNQLRMQRQQMVQSPVQYCFLYEVLKQAWHEKYDSYSGGGGGDGDGRGDIPIAGGEENGGEKGGTISMVTTKSSQEHQLGGLPMSLTDPFLDDGGKGSGDTSGSGR